MGEDQHHAAYSNYKEGSKEETLQQVVESYEAISSGIRNWVANLSNASSIVWHAYQALKVPVNWCGFYVLEKENGLILGPFQGKVACQQITFGSGVCGTAASTQKTQLVPDVEKFPGHIACDGDTKSEIVVPLVKDGNTIGVLDIDCLSLNGFDEIDVKYLEKLALLIVETIDF